VKLPIELGARVQDLAWFHKSEGRVIGLDGPWAWVSWADGVRTTVDAGELEVLSSPRTIPHHEEDSE
jgi:hypothetical protein